MSLLATGRALAQSRPSGVFAPTSIWREDATALTLSESQVSKEKLANQLFYNTAAQAGKFYGYEGMGYGGAAEGFATIIGATSFSNALYVVPSWTPRVKVWYVKEEAGPEETLQPSGWNSSLQSYFEAVPMPDPTQTLLGSLEPSGTDRQVVIWCPATDEMWELHRLGKFLAGSHEREWKFGAGAYYSKVSTSDGIPPNKWGTSASALGVLGGDITMRDLVAVLRGKAIGHALRLAVPVGAAEFVAPALRHDSGAPFPNTHELLEDGKTANPAFGSADEIPEGLWCRFPPTSRASEYGMSGPLEVAVYEAIREHGLAVTDHGGVCELFMCDPRSEGSIYSDTTASPLAETTNVKLQEYIATLIPAGRRDPTLPKFEEQLSGKSSVLANMPWRSLEQLAPRAS